MTLAGVVWSEAVRHEVEVVDGKLIIEHIPVLLRRRPAAVLAASAVHAGGDGRGCVCVRPRRASTAPCRTLRRAASWWQRRRWRQW